MESTFDMNPTIEGGGVFRGGKPVGSEPDSGVLPGWEPEEEAGRMPAKLTTHWPTCRPAGGPADRPASQAHEPA